MPLRTVITWMFCLLFSCLLFLLGAGCGDGDRPETCDDKSCEPTNEGSPAFDAGNESPAPSEPPSQGPSPKPDAGTDDGRPEDSGMGAAADASAPEDAGPAEAPIPQDGSQLTPCETNLDCEAGLMCYMGTLDQLGYCSAPCTAPPFGTGMECASAAGADYSCSPSRSLCEIECAENDDSNCPTGMECVNVGFGLPAFRCLYAREVDVPDREGAPFEPCRQDRDCADDLLCPPQLGYCAEQCVVDSHCATAPEVGEAVCDTLNHLCLVSCQDDNDCAGGFACGFVPQGLAQVLACRVVPSP